MSTPGEEPQEQTPTTPGSYGEIAPGVPRYGQYAPAGWEPPQEVKDALSGDSLPAAPAYPGFQGGPGYQGGPSYPGGPGFQGGPGTPLSPEKGLVPPGKVLLACRLILIAGVMQAISVIGLLVALMVPAVKSSIVDVLQESLSSTPELAAVYADSTLIDTVLFLAFVLSIAMTASYFLLARAIRKGSNGARTTALVLALLSLFLLGQLNPLTIIQVGLGLFAVYLLFKSPAKEFFLAHKARKAQQGMSQR